MKCHTTRELFARQAGRVMLLAAAALAVVLFHVQPARAANFGLSSFNARVVNAAGDDEAGAGVHPYAATVQFDFNRITDAPGGTPDQNPDENVKDVIVDLPPGFVGNPSGIPQCPRAALNNQRLCSPATQVGLITVRALSSPQQSSGGYDAVFTHPVFNMERTHGEVADFGFNVSGVALHIAVSLRTDGSYGVRTTVSNISEVIAVSGITLTLWGVPADAAHDPQRQPAGGFYECFGEQSDPACSNPAISGGGGQASVAPVPLLTNPTLCGAPLDTKIAVDSWQHRGDWRYGTSTTATGPSGCDSLTFDPTITATPDTTQADSPTGLAVDLTVPQNAAPSGTATPSLKKAVVTLPAGVSINPSAADGLIGCTDAQIAINTTDPVTCPGSSKIGDVEIDTPLLSEPLAGGIYLGAQVPGKPYRIFLDAENPSYGISIRLEGILTLDAIGTITATFANNPQLPFNELKLRFKGGPRAPLATPQTCGTVSTTSELTPWASLAAGPATPSNPINISWDGNGAPCPAPGFSPSFDAGTTNTAGGADTPFTLTFGRNDRERYLNDIALSLPNGLLGRIGSVPPCPDAAAKLGTCSAVSQVGTTQVASGAGTSPYYLGGKVYVTGPYKGAPFGLAIVVDATHAGPYNLGLVVVRAGIYVDRHTAALRIVSDSLPTIIEGIPLRIRKVNVLIDRKGFMFNPTNCSASNISAVVGSVAGPGAYERVRFGVGGCDALPFKPSMKISAGGKHRTGARASTPLDVVLTMPNGDANNKAVEVTMPSSLNAHLAALQHPCTQADFDADKCGRLAKVGTASAVTPLLRNPLHGGVYFVKNPKKGTLPFMEVALRGQVAVDLKATIRTTPLISARFASVPDVPITRFRLSLMSGTQGPIGVRTDLCKAASIATAGFRGQNGKLVKAKPKLHVSGCHRG